MLRFNQYVRAKDLEEAYTLYQKKNNAIIGGMLWMKMSNKTISTAIDLCELGLDQVEENESEFRLGAYVTLRTLETDEALNAYTHGALCDAVKHIVGVQSRNCATLGGSLWGRYGFSDVMTIFRALGAKVVLYKAGEITLDQLIAMPRTQRDVLTHIIIPKTMKGVAYESLRNQSTDFPVLTCASSYDGENWRTVVGATPYLAQLVINEELMPADAALLTREKADEFAAWAAEHIRFDSNMRAGAEYRKTISKVLIRRTLLQVKKITSGEEA